MTERTRRLPARGPLAMPVMAAMRAMLALVAISLPAVSLGCASALKPLDPDSDLAAGAANGSVGDAAEAERLAAEAQRLYDRRPDLEAVRSSEALWRRAALADPAAVAGVIGLSRAQTWLARNLASPEERDKKATEAVQTAQWCAEREPAHLECPYWLALAVGVQAEQRRVTAVDGLQVMIDLLKRAIANDEELDHGGPHRVLALVLVKAPGWPTGPGDPDAGLVEARRAVEIDPLYPPNLLALADAYAAVEEPGSARRHYAEALAAAREWEESGHPDAGDWVAEAEAALDKGRGG